MYKRAITLLLAGTMLISSTMAVFPQDTKSVTVFQQKVGSFIVSGHLRNGQYNAACMAVKEYETGIFALFSDVHDGELYINWSDLNWNILDKPGTHVDSQLIMEGKNKDTKVLKMILEVVGNDKIRIRGIKPEFIFPFSEFSTMKLAVKGEVKATLSLTDSSASINSLAKCFNLVNQKSNGDTGVLMAPTQSKPKLDI